MNNLECIVTFGKEKVKFNEEAGTMGDERESVSLLQNNDKKREKQFKAKQKHNLIKISECCYTY